MSGTQQHSPEPRERLQNSQSLVSLCGSLPVLGGSRSTQALVFLQPGWQEQRLAASIPRDRGARARAPKPEASTDPPGSSSDTRGKHGEGASGDLWGLLQTQLWIFT